MAGRRGLVGIDSVNIDDTATGERPVHTALLAAGIPCSSTSPASHSSSSPASGSFAVPVKVRGMGTFPVRAFARYQ